IVIYFVGDPHGCWDLIVPTILERRPTAIVLLGDMELARPLHAEMKPILDAGIEVYFIPGNHDGDDPDGLAYLLDSDLADNNLSGS
ncbi:metallophosphoesterase, partial [Staphylococcus aureus]